MRDWLAVLFLLGGCSSDPEELGRISSVGHDTSADAGGDRSDPSYDQDAFGCGEVCDPKTQFQPDFGTTVSLPDPPPPASGGTLATSPDGRWAVVADPDRDQVYVVDLTPAYSAKVTLERDPAVVATIGLLPHDEPGRVVVDGSLRAHVALRGGGALVSIDLVTNEVMRRAACPAPRGVAWDSATDSVHVACATGELVTFPASGGAPTRTVIVERDLRDVVVVSGALYVSTFKTAELLRLDSEGKVAQRLTPPLQGRFFTDAGSNGLMPFAAWRTITVGTDIWMLLQATGGSLSTFQGGYGGWGCEDAIPIFVAMFHANGTSSNARAIGNVTLVLDVAARSPSSAVIPILGNAHNKKLPHWMIFDTSNPPRSCDGGTPHPPTPVTGFDDLQLTAVATTGSRILLQSREPARLLVLDSNGLSKALVTLANESREDTGHAVFHSNASTSVACGSCHLEGGEDGIVWALSAKKRRTPSLRGTVAGTAPYHWEGDMTDIPKLLADVYSKRMNGGLLSGPETNAVISWVESIPRPPAIAGDDNARARGKWLFQGKGGCTGCHAGPKLTDNTAHTIGSTTPFQTPPLVGVGWRAPFLHDGCAKTLTERFSAKCNAAVHGGSLALSAAEITDVVAYLDSL